MATPTSVRLPVDLDARRSAYCVDRGCVKSRILVLALRDFLGDAPPPPVTFPRHDEPDEPETAR